MEKTISVDNRDNFKNKWTGYPSSNLKRNRR